MLHHLSQYPLYKLFAKTVSRSCGGWPWDRLYLRLELKRTPATAETAALAVVAVVAAGTEGAAEAAGHQRRQQHNSCWASFTLFIRFLRGKKFEKKVLDEKERCPILRACHQRVRATLISSSWAEPVGTWLGWFGQGSAWQGLGEIGS